MQRHVFLGRLGLWSLATVSLSADLIARARAAAGPNDLAVANAFGAPIEAQWKLLASTQAFNAYYAFISSHAADAVQRTDARVTVTPDPSQKPTAVLAIVEMTTPNAVATFSLRSRLKLNRGAASGGLGPPSTTSKAYGIVARLSPGSWEAEITSDDTRASCVIVVPELS
jgi:hypothetical protein